MSTKIHPLWLDGPLKGSDYAIDWPLASGRYEAVVPPTPEEMQSAFNRYAVAGPTGRTHVYNFHKFAVLSHVLIIASEYLDIADLNYAAMNDDTLFNYVVSDRARKAERP
jgi:hypothetical protein